MKSDRKRPTALRSLVLAGLTLAACALPARVHGIGASLCPPCGGQETLSPGQPLAIANGFTNDSTSQATITIMMNSNIFFGPAHVVLSPTLDAGITQNMPDMCLNINTTVDTPVGTDHIVLVVTSDVTGTTVLQQCEFDLTIQSSALVICPGDVAATADAGLHTAAVNYTPPNPPSGLTAQVDCTPPAGSVFPLGQTTVKCTLGGAGISTNTCSFIVTVKDSELLSLTCSTNIVQASDPGLRSAVVTFVIQATNNGEAISNTAICSPPSGSTFPPGPTSVSCSVTNGSTNSASCTFTVTVLDNELPSITCSTNIVQTNDLGQCSAVVTFVIQATNQGDPNPITAICNPPSESVFPSGVTTVSCSVTNGSATSTNSASCIFTVTVVDREPPSITCSTNIVQANDWLQCSAVVTYFAVATDNCDIATFGCNPHSGSTFPKGATPVTCSVTDTSGNSNSCHFTVTVQDREAPRVTVLPGTNPSGKKVPGKISKSGVNPDGFYQVLARDNCDPGPQIFVKDSASSFVAGPFKNGDNLKIVQAPGGKPGRKKGPGVIVAHLTLNGDPLVYARDADGNVSVPVNGKVPPGK